MTRKTGSIEALGGGVSCVEPMAWRLSEGAIVTSIHKVSDLVSQIAAASTEQCVGMVQVSNEVGPMEQTTQQNAALVEQSAAAVESLKQQTHEFVESVSTFKL